MRVKVTLDNIRLYGLDTVTGNSEADLMYQAAEEWALTGRDMYVIIPDVLGGDTEAPTERNTFEHYSEMPDPDGLSHEQISIDPYEET